MHDLSSFLTFISANIHVAGWFSLIAFVIKLSWKLSRFFNSVETSMETIHTVATNHLPHLQEGLETLSRDIKDNTTEVRDMRKDLLTFLLNTKL